MNFKNGETIYQVHAFPANEKFYVNKYKVVKNSTMQHTNTPSLIVKDILSGYESEISLRDANVIPNTYNSHRLFKTKLKAINYINNPELWRPLGITQEDWDTSGKANYLLDKELDSIDAEYWDI